MDDAFTHGAAIVPWAPTAEGSKTLCLCSWLVNNCRRGDTTFPASRFTASTATVRKRTRLHRICYCARLATTQECCLVSRGHGVPMSMERDGISFNETAPSC